MVKQATSESKIVAAAVPIGMARELKNAAARSDRSVSAEIRRALARHLHEDQMPAALGSDGAVTFEREGEALELVEREQ